MKVTQIIYLYIYIYICSIKVRRQSRRRGCQRGSFAGLLGGGKPGLIFWQFFFFAFSLFVALLISFLCFCSFGIPLFPGCKCNPKCSFFWNLCLQYFQYRFCSLIFSLFLFLLEIFCVAANTFTYDQFYVLGLRRVLAFWQDRPV